MDDVTERAVRNTTEEANRFTRNLTETSERAAQANTKLMTDQADALRHVWQTSADMASNLTKRSADQVARTLGIGGDEAGYAAGQASENIGALVQSTSALAENVRAISIEWVDFVRHSTERSIDQMDAMMRSRSPSDFVASQAHAFRDNMEALIDSGRRISEIALRTADKASREIARNLKPGKPGE